MGKTMSTGGVHPLMSTFLFFTRRWRMMTLCQRALHDYCRLLLHASLCYRFTRLVWRDADLKSTWLKSSAEV